MKTRLFSLSEKEKPRPLGRGFVDPLIV